MGSGARLPIGQWLSFALPVHGTSWRQPEGTQSKGCTFSTPAPCSLSLCSQDQVSTPSCNPEDLRTGLPPQLPSLFTPQLQPQPLRSTFQMHCPLAFSPLCKPFSLPANSSFSWQLNTRLPLDPHLGLVNGPSVSQPPGCPSTALALAGLSSGKTKAPMPLCFLQLLAGPSFRG